MYLKRKNYFGMEIKTRILNNKLLIFDMDGTIIDTDVCLIKTWEELFRLYKKDGSKFNPEKIKEYSGPPLDYAISDAFPEMDRTFIHKEYRARTKKYYDTDLKIFDNAYEVIKNFYDLGYTLAILTAKNEEMTKRCLKEFNLLDCFSEFVTVTSGLQPKPSREGIDYLLNKLNIKRENAIMIGDTNYDALAARNAKIKSILLTMRERNGIDRNNVDYFAKDYLELKKIVEEIND